MKLSCIFHRLLIAIILLSAPLSCKSKKKTIEETRSTEIEVIHSILDSVNRVNKSILKQLNESSQSSNTRLILTPIIDSNGIAMPISFKEEKNGQVTREITLAGGKLEEINEDEIIKRETKISIDSSAKSNKTKIDANLKADQKSDMQLNQESKPSNVFFSWFWFWLILAIIVLIYIGFRRLSPF